MMSVTPPRISMKNPAAPMTKMNAVLIMVPLMSKFEDIPDAPNAHQERHRSPRK